MGLLNFFRNLRNRTRPRKLHAVKLAVWSESANRYVGDFVVTTDATSKADAKNNAKDDLRLHVVDAWVPEKTMSANKD